MTAELLDPHHIRRDLRQLESSILKGFTIPDVLYEKTASIVGKILHTGKPREQLAAARVIAAMAEVNLKIQAASTTQHVEHHHTHELGPVTADNIADHRRKLLEEIG